MFFVFSFYCKYMNNNWYPKIICRECWQAGDPCLIEDLHATLSLQCLEHSLACFFA